MKTLLFTRNVLVALFFSVAALAEPFFQSEFMKPKEAEKKWGIKSLNKEAFRTGDHSKREAMAVDIIKNKLYIGKPMKIVRQELGEPDSYFFSDTIFAYKIMPFLGENMENWHLVFIPDEKLENVKEVKIHKKCCYKLPF